MSLNRLKKSGLPEGCEKRGEKVGVATGVFRWSTFGGPDGGNTGNVRSDPESLSKSLSSASLRSLNADLGTLGTSSRKVLTSAISKPNTSANLQR